MRGPETVEVFGEVLAVDVAPVFQAFVGAQAFAIQMDDGRKVGGIVPSSLRELDPPLSPGDRVGMLANVRNGNLRDITHARRLHAAGGA